MTAHRQSYMVVSGTAPDTIAIKNAVRSGGAP